MGMRDAADVQPSQSPAVTAPPKGEPSRVPVCTCIGAFLPLPSGEVAMPSGIDGEGDVSGIEALATPLSVTCGDSFPKGGAKAYSRLHPH